MLVSDLVRGLHSNMRRNILRLLSEKDRTAVEIYRELKEDAPKFRQSVNKALEILRGQGFVNKYYDMNREALYYQIVKREYHINLKDMSVE